MTKVEFRDYQDPDRTLYEFFMPDVPQKDDIVDIAGRERWVSRVVWHPEESTAVVITTPMPWEL